MPESGVRAARTSDVDDIADVNVRSWRQRFADILPASILDGLDARDLSMAWAHSLLNPPSPDHWVLVAVHDGAIVGYVTVGPSLDPDAGPTDGELSSLEVDPGHQRLGHGSRLLTAAMDHAEAAGIGTVSVWCALGDEARRAFLQSAGWAPDSAYRDLIVDWTEASGDIVVREVRLSASLPPPDEQGQEPTGT
jgi:ribosomal protein S18 acetylase RimI-like enzyme